MFRQKCYFVPPYLFDRLAKHVGESSGDRLGKAIGDARKAHMEQLTTRPAAGSSKPRIGSSSHSARQTIVPEYILQRISKVEKKAEKSNNQALVIIEDGEVSDKKEHYRAVYDAQNIDDVDALPGKEARVEGEKAVSDSAVNEAYDNAGIVLDFYSTLFGWDSLDNKNMPIISSVHFGTHYGNAFWDLHDQQMVYGDGNKYVHNFTKCIDVIGHEMTHAVTEYSNPLHYIGQSGALNEHISDVFGIMVKQKVENETADEADWLIGEGCFMPLVKGVAIRNMAKPGTAYDDEILGKDPQPDNFADYKPTFEDNGGVHIYCGIPNRAFYLSAVGFGGYSWEKAGKIWWNAMRSGHVGPKADFHLFALVTIDFAKKMYGNKGKKIVKDAWTEVGVIREDSDWQCRIA